MFSVFISILTTIFDHGTNFSTTWTLFSVLTCSIYADYAMMFEWKNIFHWNVFLMRELAVLERPNGASYCIIWSQLEWGAEPGRNSTSGFLKAIKSQSLLPFSCTTCTLVFLSLNITSRLFQMCRLHSISHRWQEKLGWLKDCDDWFSQVNLWLGLVFMFEMGNYLS